MKKLAAFALTLSLAAASLTGCASGGAATSAQATAENPMVLTLAHGLRNPHRTYCHDRICRKGGRRHRRKNPDPDSSQRPAGI